MEREILFISKDTSILEHAKQSAIECNLKISCTIPCGVHLSYAASNYALAIVHLSTDISDEIAVIRWIDSHKGTPIAAFSDNPSREEEIFLLYSGADQYWGLPVDYELIKALFMHSTIAMRGIAISSSATQMCWSLTVAFL